MVLRCLVSLSACARFARRTILSAWLHDAVSVVIDVHSFPRKRESTKHLGPSRVANQFDPKRINL
jgi:hypothetical protein